MRNSILVIMRFCYLNRDFTLNRDSLNRDFTVPCIHTNCMKVWNHGSKKGAGKIFHIFLKDSYIRLDHFDEKRGEISSHRQSWPWKKIFFILQKIFWNCAKAPEEKNNLFKHWPKDNNMSIIEEGAKKEPLRVTNHEFDQISSLFYIFFLGFRNKLPKSFFFLGFFRSVWNR